MIMISLSLYPRNELVKYKVKHYYAPNAFLYYCVRD